MTKSSSGKLSILFRSVYDGLLKITVAFPNFAGEHFLESRLCQQLPTGIAEFLGAHAEAAYQAMGADESMEDAKYLWRRIAASGEAEISKRDLFRLVQGKFKKTEGMEAPLRVLVEYGYIRIEDVERDGAGRKASPKIKINPLTR